MSDHEDEKLEINFNKSNSKAKPENAEKLASQDKFTQNDIFALTVNDKSPPLDFKKRFKGPTKG
jgi:hypothetical protein